MGEIVWNDFFMLLVCSLITNAVLLCLVFWLIYRIRKPGKAQKTLTVDADQLLSELLRGRAVTVTQVIDPNQIFVWSAKR